MLSGLIGDMPTILAMILQPDTSSIHGPTSEEFLRILLRCSHFVAGVLWIGLLYFFNLVNVPLMKKLDGPTKKLVIPELMPRALWYFRWGAVATVLAGFGYYASFIVASNARNVGEDPGAWLGEWLLVALVLYAVLYFTIDKVNNGYVIAAVAAVLVVVLIAAILYLLPHADNKTFSIGVGGGIGLWMMLNVWGIIWRVQKKIIADNL